MGESWQNQKRPMPLPLLGLMKVRILLVTIVIQIIHYPVLRVEVIIVRRTREEVNALIERISPKDKFPKDVKQSMVDDFQPALLNLA